MNVVEIRNRKIGEGADEDGFVEDWVEQTVFHRDTTAKDVCREYYPDYKLQPKNKNLPKSLNPKVMEVNHYYVTPQKEKIYDPHAPASDVRSELIEVPS